MSTNYKSTLTKETLIYNLLYHLKGCKADEATAAVVRQILTTFEEKELTNP